MDAPRGTSSLALRYQAAIAQEATEPDRVVMSKKRVLASVMWIYSCWMVGGVAEFFIGTPALLGPALGIAAAVFFGLDPLGVVWHKTEEKTFGVERSPSAETTPAIGSAVAQ